MVPKSRFWVLVTSYCPGYAGRSDSNTGLDYNGNIHRGMWAGHALTLRLLIGITKLSRMVRDGKILAKKLQGNWLRFGEASMIMIGAGKCSSNCFLTDAWGKTCASIPEHLKGLAYSREAPSTKNMALSERITLSELIPSHPILKAMIFFLVNSTHR